MLIRVQFIDIFVDLLEKALLNLWTGQQLQVISPGRLLEVRQQGCSGLCKEGTLIGQLLVLVHALGL